MKKKKKIRKISLTCQFVIQLPCPVWLFPTPWTAAYQASLSFTSSQNLFKLMSIESVMHPTVLFPVVLFSSYLQSILASGSFPMNELFISGSQSIAASASPSNEYSGLISSSIDWLDLLTV